VCSSDLLEAVLEILAAGRVAPHFQPVVDLFAAETAGFEVLSRFPDVAPCPEALFAAARAGGLAWELEQLCRRAALCRLADATEITHQRMVSFNVSLGVFLDPRFVREWSASTVRRAGLDPQQVVLELTPTGMAPEFAVLEETVRHFTAEGFRIALDDYGAGRGNLALLFAIEPQYLKLDRGLVNGIEGSPPRQRLLRRVINCASQLGCRLVAEGVETHADLSVLARQGVRYAQGAYFCLPVPDPVLPDAETPSFRALDTLACGAGRVAAAEEHAIVDLVQEPAVYAPAAVTCEGLDTIFRRTPSLDHVVVRLEGRGYGLVTRQHFYGRAGGPFGYSLYQRKPIEDIARRDPLVVSERTDIAALCRLAMNRQQNELYDPVVVTAADGELRGTITMQALLTRSIDLEVSRAQSANPLTRLPGNVMIQKWLREALEHPPFTVIYGDLDSFKEYNDVFGFPMGDEMIKLAASVLQRQLKEISLGARLGHLGGDDFVIVAPESVLTETLQLVCDAFDEEKLELFDPETVAQGCYKTTDRDGHPRCAPLVTLSLAVLTEANVGDGVHPARFGEMAASLKKEIKRLNAVRGRSGYLFDQRDYALRPAGCS